MTRRQAPQATTAPTCASRHKLKRVLLLGSGSGASTARSDAPCTVQRTASSGDTTVEPACIERDGRWPTAVPRRRRAPNPWVGCVIVSGHDPRWSSRGRPPPRGPARRDHRVGPGRRPACPGGDAVHHPRAVRPPRADAALYRRHHRGGSGPGGHRHRGPRPASGRVGGWRALRAAGIAVTVGSGAAEVTEQLAPVPQAPHHRAALGRPEDGRQPRCADRRARRHQPLDHRGRRPAATCTASGPDRTPSWWGPGRSGPTILS